MRDEMLTVGAPVRFEELYRTGYRRVYRLAWALGGQTAAEELTQDAFLHAHRNWAEVAELDDPLPWVVVNEHELGVGVDETKDQPV